MKYVFVLVAALAFPLGAAAEAPEGGRTGEAKFIGVTHAVRIAEQEMVARAVEADMERRKGYLVYEVKLVDRDTVFKAYVNARTGEIVSTRSMWLRNQLDYLFGSDRYDVMDATISLGDVLQQLEAASPGVVREVEFDTEGGVPVYEIEMSSPAGEATIYVDVLTGDRILGDL